MTLTQITTEGIKDGTITNADIGSSAAIARTKLANVDLVDDTSPQLGGDLASNAKNILFADSSGTGNNRLKFGDSGDLALYHDGNNSYLAHESGTGDLILNTDSTCSINPNGGGHFGLRVITNGSVELYEANSKKLETTADGADCFNRFRVLGGTAPSIQFNSDSTGANTATRTMFGQATGNNNFINGSSPDDVVLNTPHRFIVGHATNEIMAIFDPDGAVEIYHNNNKKFETFADGIIVGKGNGGVGLTINDGQGNANVTFNHAGELPDQNGNAGRIAVNVDSSTNANMKFELKSGVTSGTNVNTIEILELREDEILAKKPLVGTTSARAWVNFNKNGTIRDDYNVSSITDNGTGDYTVNFTTNMTDTDYAWFASGGRGGNQGAICATQDTTEVTASAFRFTTRNLSNNKEDFTHMCAGFFR